MEDPTPRPDTLLRILPLLALLALTAVVAGLPAPAGAQTAATVSLSATSPILDRMLDDIDFLAATELDLVSGASVSTAKLYGKLLTPADHEAGSNPASCPAALSSYALLMNTGSTPAPDATNAEYKKIRNFNKSGSPGPASEEELERRYGPFTLCLAAQNASETAALFEFPFARVRNPGFSFADVPHMRGGIIHRNELAFDGSDVAVTPTVNVPGWTHAGTAIVGRGLPCDGSLTFAGVVNVRRREGLDRLGYCAKLTRAVSSGTETAYIRSGYFNLEWTPSVYVNPNEPARTSLPENEVSFDFGKLRPAEGLDALHFVQAPGVVNEAPTEGDNALFEIDADDNLKLRDTGFAADHEGDRADYGNVYRTFAQPYRYPPPSEVRRNISYRTLAGESIRRYRDPKIAEGTIIYYHNVRVDWVFTTDNTPSGWGGDYIQWLELAGDVYVSTDNGVSFRKITIHPDHRLRLLGSKEHYWKGDVYVSEDGLPNANKNGYYIGSLTIDADDFGDIGSNPKVPYVGSKGCYLTLIKITTVGINNYYYRGGRGCLTFTPWATEYNDVRLPHYDGGLLFDSFEPRTVEGGYDSDCVTGATPWDLVSRVAVTNQVGSGGFVDHNIPLNTTHTVQGEVWWAQPGQPYYRIPVDGTITLPSQSNATITVDQLGNLHVG